MLKGIAVETTQKEDGTLIYTLHWLLPIDDDHWHDHQEVCFTKKELNKRLEGIKKWLVELY